MPTSKETGILFTPENIRAIRDGRKSQTRRVMVPQQSFDHYHTMWCWKTLVLDNIWDFPNGDDRKELAAHCPYGVPGDRLYIKEGVIVDEAFNPPELAGYYIDGARATLPNQKRLTAMFMAKRYARTWLEITDVRVERLQDISDEDARAEGVSPQIVTEQDIQDTINGASEPHIKELARILGPGEFTARFKFMELWDSINRKKYPWESNPWVWAITFMAS
jgi:hypothetical protein